MEITSAGREQTGEEEEIKRKRKNNMQETQTHRADDKGIETNNFI